ncbi:MAG: DnaA regulatory inactivator Hda [Verrucomicrobiaceae bacterium]|nr:DnaA regulatory inactivator Hda [Verrucomicrobiaceae bacterium]
MPQQLPLFRPRTDASFDNFVVIDANATAVHALRQWLLQTNGYVFYLFGSKGCGRSHLLQAACRDSAAIYLPMQELKTQNPQAVCEGLEHAEIVCIDDVDVILTDLAWCEQLFHLCNRLLAAQRKLLVSASSAAATAPCVLPDLQSRLSWGGSFKLLPLDDDGLARALKIRARERGFDLDGEVIAYILARYSRNMEALLALLHELDRHSLAEHKRITIPFVRRFIDAVDASGET